MRSTRSDDLSNPEPAIDRLFPAVLLAAQGIVWFLLGLIIGWLLWG